MGAPATVVAERGDNCCFLANHSSGFVCFFSEFVVAVSKVLRSYYAFHARQRLIQFELVEGAGKPH